MNEYLDPNNWVVNYGDKLYVFALKRLGGHTAIAEDIVQETFTAAWRARETFTGLASEKTWLFTICKNKIIDHYRKHGKYTVEELTTEGVADEYFREDGHFQSTFKPTQDWGEAASHKLQQKEFLGVLEQCKSRLKQLQQQVFSLKYLQEIETDEICSLLGITAKNYWVLMHRAKIHLRTCLEKNWMSKQ